MPCMRPGLTPSKVRGWNATLAAKHPSTASKAYRLLSTMMRNAVDDELVVKSPCKVVGAATERAAERPVATVAEIEALAKTVPGRLRLLVELATWCQLRRGELLGLQRNDVDMLDATIRIERSRTFKRDGSSLTKSQKTKSGMRTLSAGSFQRAWSNARLAVGRPDLHLHDLRHTGLTFAAATGATTAELMHRAGHASAAASLRYQHATHDRDQVLADALAEIAIRPQISRLKKSEK